jgi:phosphohistidine phosphatase SixA
MRHARAPGTGDPSGFKLGDCATQRNLDASGREQARRIGESLRRHGIAPDLVLTSAWCRSTDTARLLGAGPVVVEPLLNSFFGQEGRGGEQTRRVSARIAELGARKAIMVTHQVNITALTGIIPASGEIVVVAMPFPGKLAVVGRIRVD